MVPRIVAGSVTGWAGPSVREHRTRVEGTGLGSIVGPRRPALATASPPAS